MKSFFLYGLLLSLIISCANTTNSENKVEQQLNQPQKILIGTVKTTQAPAKFYEVTQPHIVEQCFKLFADTIKYNTAAPQNYDHRIQFFKGNQLIEEVFVKETDHNLPYWDVYNMATGHTIQNKDRHELITHAKPLTTKFYTIPNTTIAKQFYAHALSKETYLFTPHFCRWQEYEGELHLSTNINGEPLRQDTLENLIRRNYPDYTLEIQSMDVHFGNYPVPRRIKIKASKAFFDVFEFRGRRFEELKQSDSLKAIFSSNIGANYTASGLRTPLIINDVDILKKLNNKTDTIPLSKTDTIEKVDVSYDFSDYYSKEYYEIYDPIIEVITDSLTIVELDVWLNNKKKQPYK
jgi:hypothetical protein